MSLAYGVEFQDRLENHREQFIRDARIVLKATAPDIAARALRLAAHDLNGSDPAVDLVVEWLLTRAKLIEKGEI